MFYTFNLNPLDLVRGQALEKLIRVDDQKPGNTESQIQILALKGETMEGFFEKDRPRYGVKVYPICESRKERKKRNKEVKRLKKEGKEIKEFINANAPVDNKICYLATMAWLADYIKNNQEAEINTEALRRLIGENAEKVAKGELTRKDADDKEKDFKADSFFSVAFSFNGEKRKLENLTAHTGLMVIDFDDFTTDYPDYTDPQRRLDDIRDLLVNDILLTTVLYFVSPRKKGGKWVIKTNVYELLAEWGITEPTYKDYDRAHKYFFKAIKTYLKQSWHLTVDESGSDIARPCWISHDADCYYNENWCNEDKIFNVHYWHDFGKEEKSATRSLPNDNAKGNGVTEYPKTTLLTDAQVEETIRRLELNNEHLTEQYKDWVIECGFSLAAEFGHGAGDYFHRLSRLSSKYDYDECSKKWNKIVNDADGRKGIGSFFGWAENHGVNHKDVCKNVLQELNKQISQGIISTEKSPKYPNTHPVLQNEEFSIKNNNILNINDIYKNNAKTEICETTRGNGDIGDLRREKIEKTFSQNLTVIGLPIIFREISEYFDDNPQRCDIAILSVIAQMLPCLYNIYFVYDSRPYYPSLFFLLEAPSGGGKNLASTAAKILAPIEEQTKKEYEIIKEQYKRDKALWEANGKRRGEPEPECPPEPKIKIDGNTSSASLLLSMKANGGFIVINESEGENFVKMKGNSWSQYLPIIRAAMSNETISSNRATQDLSVSIEDPRIGVVIGCQPSITKQIFSNAGIGDIQRTTLYEATRDNRILEFRYGRSQGKKLITDLFKDLGIHFMDIYNQMKARENKVELVLTEEQNKRLFIFQNEMWNEFGEAFGEAFDGKLVRLAIEMHNIILIFTLCYRYEERMKKNKPLFETFEQALPGDERAIEICLRMMEVLMRHTSSIWQRNRWSESLSTQTFTNNLSAQQMEFYQTIPETFTRKEWNQTSTELGIPLKTSEKWLSQFDVKYNIITKIKHGEYRKCRP